MKTMNVQMFLGITKSEIMQKITKLGVETSFYMRTYDYIRSGDNISKEKTDHLIVGYDGIGESITKHLVNECPVFVRGILLRDDDSGYKIFCKEISFLKNIVKENNINYNSKENNKTLDKVLSASELFF